MVIKYVGGALQIPAAANSNEAVAKSQLDAVASRVTTLEGSTGSASGLRPTITKTAAYTAVANDLVLCNTSGGAFTVTLPASPAANTVIGVKKVDASGTVVTVVPNASPAGQSIDGDSQLTLETPGVAAVMIYDGATWRISSTTNFDNPLSMLWRGAHSTSIAYNINDVVSYNGGSYVALIANTNVVPTAGASSATWGLMSAKGDQGIQGTAGTNGTNGATGAAGPGVIAAGKQYQVLRKKTDTDYDTEWSWNPIPVVATAAERNALPNPVNGMRCITSENMIEWTYVVYTGPTAWTGWVPAAGTIVAGVYQTAQQLIPDQSTPYTAITFGATMYPSWPTSWFMTNGTTYNAWTTGTNNSDASYLRAPWAGMYEITGGVSFVGQSAGMRYAAWRFNTSGLLIGSQVAQYHGSTSQFGAAMRTANRPLTQGAIIEMVVSQTGSSTGGGLNTNIAGGTQSYAVMKYMGFDGYNI